MRGHDQEGKGQTMRDDVPVLRGEPTRPRDTGWSTVPTKADFG